MLNSKDFTTALEIISKHHSTELAINTPKDNFLEYNPTLYNEDYDWIDKLCEASQDLTGRLTEQFKEYVQGDYKVNEVGNGITMVTSNRAGIALTFADSDLGMYITYMETLA